MHELHTGRYGPRMLVTRTEVTSSTTPPDRRPESTVATPQPNSAILRALWRAFGTRQQRYSMQLMQPERSAPAACCPARVLEYRRHAQRAGFLAYRTGYLCVSNPSVHGRQLSQDVVAGWLGLTQPQLSRIESGRAIEDLGRLIPYAQALGIPRELLWFKLPDSDEIPDAPPPLTLPVIVGGRSVLLPIDVEAARAQGLDGLLGQLVSAEVSTQELEGLPFPSRDRSSGTVPSRRWPVPTSPNSNTSRGRARRRPPLHGRLGGRAIPPPAREVQGR